MIKNIVGGILIGGANIIPGVSGGTIIVMLGIFDKTMSSISNLFKIKISWKERLEAFKFLFTLMIGVGIGLVVFAKILTFLFDKFPNQTLACFSGLILFSLPSLKKQEMKDSKISIISFIAGILLIGALVFFSQGTGELTVSLDEIVSKTLDIKYILTLFLLGAISGGAMIFPGISGSMVLLILGWYHLFKGYVANITSFEPNIIIGLIIIALGVGIGIILSAKLTTYLLNKHRTGTMSFILGLILMSAITIIPLKGYDVITVITSILTFILGAILVTLLEKKNLKEKTND